MSKSLKHAQDSVRLKKMCVSSIFTSFVFMGNFYYYILCVFVCVMWEIGRKSGGRLMYICHQQSGKCKGNWRYFAYEMLFNFSRKLLYFRFLRGPKICTMRIYDTFWTYLKFNKVGRFWKTTF